MATDKNEKRPSYAGAPEKAPTKIRAWESPSRGHSASYSGRYDSKGKFAQDLRKGGPR